MVNQFKGSKTAPPQFTRGYGLVFGFSERKAMAMALVDRAMRAEELGEDVTAPAQNVEFVLYHSDNIEATGFVEHLKLPHYVDFQSELQNVRRMRARSRARRNARRQRNDARAMAGHGPAIHVRTRRNEDMDRRHKRGHDDQCAVSCRDTERSS